MNDVAVIQNDMSQEGRRTLHVMAAESLRERAQYIAPLPEWAEVREWEDEIRLHHLTATWLAREAMYYTFRWEGNGRKHPVAIWALEPGQRISDAAVDAALIFFGTFDTWPSAAWVRTWPKGLQEEDAFIPISEGVGMDLFGVRWVPDGFVVVGGGFNQNRR